MAFPTIANTATTGETTSVTTHAIAYPTGIAAGDLLIAFFGLDLGGATITSWGGFTPLDYADVATATASGGLAYKIADGTETGTFNVTHTPATVERATAICAAISASTWHGTTPPEISTVVTASSTNPDPGSLTPSWGASDTLWIAFEVNDTTTSLAPTAAPTNYTNLLTSTSTSAATTAIAQRNLNAASEDPGAFTMTTEQWAAWTLAIRPAAAGGTTSNKAGAATTATSASGQDAYAATETGATAADTQTSGADAATLNRTGTASTAARAAGTSATGGGTTTSKTGVVSATAKTAGADAHTAAKTGAVQAATTLKGFAGDPPPPAGPAGGKHLIKEDRVRIDGIDLSAYAHGLSIEFEADQIDITGYNDTHRQYLPGERRATFQFDLFRGSPIEQILNDAQQTGRTVYVEVQPFQGAPFPTNPLWAGNCVSTRYTPLEGDTGEAAGASVALESTGQTFIRTRTETIVAEFTLISETTLVSAP